MEEQGTSKLLEVISGLHLQMDAHGDLYILVAIVLLLISNQSRKLLAQMQQRPKATLVLRVLQASMITASLSLLLSIVLLSVWSVSELI